MPLLSCDGGATTVTATYDDATLLIASVAVVVAAGRTLRLRLRTAAGAVRVENTYQAGTTTVPIPQTGANRHLLTRWATSGVRGLGWETF